MNQLKILEIINKNKDKEFVYRLLNAKDLPTLPNRDGSTSTHGLMWKRRIRTVPYAKGKKKTTYIVYPTVVLAEGEMMRLGPKTAFSRAVEYGDFIEFDNWQDADEFSKEYKKFTPFFVRTDREDNDRPLPPSIWKNLNTGPGASFNTGDNESFGDSW